VWSNISFAITSSNSSGLYKALNYLNKYYTFSPPGSVPAGYFRPGVAQITAKMCNFLGSCGTASFQLTVTGSNAPVTSIGGDHAFSTTVAAGLTLNADSYVSICNFTSGSAVPAVRRTGLAFTWAAYVGNVQVRPRQPPTTLSLFTSRLTHFILLPWLQNFALVSYSKQYYSYKLQPFSLAAGKVYTIQVTAVDTDSALSSSASVTVRVVASSVVAVIAQGATASVYQGANTTLSANPSFDQDIDPTVATGAAAGLAFKWSCQQTLPTPATTCPFNRPHGSTKEQLAVVAPSSLEVGTTALITVTVTSGGRSSSASIAVSVQSNDRPLVAITSFMSSGVVVPDRPMALSGLALATAGGYTSWSVSDTSLALDAVSLTPVSNVFVAKGFTTVLLVLPANVMTPGSKLTFTLSCKSATTGFSNTAKMTVMVNKPPYGGVFKVNPDSGTELTDTFTFTASQWSSQSLPLNYAFGFISPSTGAYSTVQQLSQKIFTTSSLPRGQDTLKYALTAQLVVYDSLLSSTLTTRQVTVRPAVISGSSLTNVITTQLANPAKAVQILSVAVALVNSVSCVAAPNCTAVNRLPCKAVQNTCGSCNAPGMLGDYRDRYAFSTPLHDPSLVRPNAHPSFRCPFPRPAATSSACR
jgi:hypothetical protein